MRSPVKVRIAILASLLIVLPAIALAGSPARIIPSDKVSLLAESDGKELNHFNSEMPLPQGLLLASAGNCVIQTQNLQLIARDKTVFALAESDKLWDLTVKHGQVDFAIRRDAKPVSFHTPQDVLEIQQAVIPVGNPGLVRGYVSVRDRVTELAVQEGALQVMTKEGVQLVEPGRSIVLAQAQMTALPEEKDKDKDKASGYIPQGGESVMGSNPGYGGGFGGVSTGGMVIGGLALGGFGAGVALVIWPDDDEKPISPF